MRQLFSVAILCACVSSVAHAQRTSEQRFSQLVGNVKVRPVSASRPTNVPFITWGADVAAFHANGGIQKTSPNSIYGRDGLNLAFYDGNDFVAQVRDYLSGKTPFLRGTMRMLGQASEVIGADSRTQPIVIAQLSWSKGDHLIAREYVRRLDDLKGKRIACQQGGPHVGLLFDALQRVQLDKSDIEIVWVKELTGPNGPAELFRKDPTIDACCVITPDMLGLTGGLPVGLGGDGTVKGAFVLNSTQHMTGSIADVYAVRSDWFEANRETVKKFVGGFLRATEEIRQQRDKYEANPKLRMSPQYRRTLMVTQSAFGKEALPTIEEDAHGLLLDCEFARLTGQIDFFKGIYDANGKLRTNPIGFPAKTDAALLLAKSWGYAGSASRFDHAKWDYEEVARVAKLRYVRPKARKDIAPGAVLPKDAASDENTIYSFEIHFDENQRTFPVSRYELQFQRAINDAALYKNAMIVIQGHSDSAATLISLISSGIKKKLIRRGTDGKLQYAGRPLEVDRMAELIASGKFSGGAPASDPAVVMQAALNLSLDRATTVKQVIVRLAEERGIALDAGRLRPDGAGISDPVHAAPKNGEQSKANRRVEFRIVRVEAEGIEAEDYDLLQGL